MAKHSEASARAIDSASIVFGLVAIPVRVFSSAEHGHEVHFHLVHADCGRRVQQVYKCPEHGEVERAELGKGYQVDKTRLIELDPKELKALDAVANDEIALAEFVPASAVDPIYVERTYYLAPGKGGDRAYRLLHDALEDAELVGIASYAARGRAYVVMVRPYRGGLAMHQLRYEDEIKPWDAIGVAALPKPKPSEVTLARSLIAQLQRDTFDPGEYRDEVKGRVQKLLAKKARSGEAIVAPEQPAAERIPDLMAALKASLGTSDDKPRSSAKPAKPNGHRATHRAAKRARPASRHRTAGGPRTRAKRAAA